MLSYRHSFHAGNYADVLKHIVSIEILEHLLKKDKPFEYIDTHSGAGLYSLESEHSQKLQEAEEGIKLLTVSEFPELKTYFDVIENAQSQNDTTLDLSKIKHYPGSPWIADELLRRNDRSWLFELHPKDFDLLSKNIKGSKNKRIQNKNGYDGLNALMPPTSKRGYVLMDPSYEVKSEYEQVAKSISIAYKKFPSGTFAIWYPVVERAWVNRMLFQLKSSGIKNIQRFELAQNTDDSEKGMTASGMIVINPPWTMLDKMKKLLPKLAGVISKEGKGGYTCEELVPE